MHLFRECGLTHFLMRPLSAAEDKKSVGDHFEGLHARLGHTDGHRRSPRRDRLSQRAAVRSRNSLCLPPSFVWWSAETGTTLSL